MTSTFLTVRLHSLLASTEATLLSTGTGHWWLCGVSCQPGPPKGSPVQNSIGAHVWYFGPRRKKGDDGAAMLSSGP